MGWVQSDITALITEENTEYFQGFCSEFYSFKKECIAYIILFNEYLYFCADVSDYIRLANCVKIKI
jgi:hypothetical protein